MNKPRFTNLHLFLNWFSMIWCHFWQVWEHDPKSREFKCWKMISKISGGKFCAQIGFELLSAIFSRWHCGNSPKKQISEAKIDIFKITFLSQRFQKTNHPIFGRFHETFDAFVDVLSEEKWQKHVIVIATTSLLRESRYFGFFRYFLTIFIQIASRNNWEKVESLHFFPRTAEQDEFDGNLFARNLNLRIWTMSVLVLQLSNWFARNSKLWLANIWSWTNKDKKY